MKSKLKGSLIISIFALIWLITATLLPNMYSLRFPKDDTIYFQFAAVVVSVISILGILLGILISVNNRKIKMGIKTLMIFVALIFSITLIRHFNMFTDCVSSGFSWNYMNSSCNQ